EEVFNIIKRGFFNMLQLFTNRHPLIGMRFVSKPAQLVPYISIRLIDIVLFEFFGYYFTLYIQRIFIKSQGKHAIALQPEGSFYIFCRKLAIIIGKVVGSVGIVFTTGHLKRLIV